MAAGYLSIKGVVFSFFIFFYCSFLPPQLQAQKGQVVHDDLFSLSFPSQSYGWACGRFGTILHTVDGGKSWAQQKSNTVNTLTGIFFTDNDNGWAVGKSGTILHTVDGGRNWASQESPVGYYHMDVFFLDKKTGFIVSERTLILATDDGGKNWEERFQDADYILKAISFCDDKHGWAVGEFGYIYHTRDGGITWQKQSGFCGIDPETGALKGGKYLFDVVAINPQSACVSGIQGTVLLTTDGGSTWKPIDVNSHVFPLYSIEFDGENTLVLGGKGVCTISKDKGITWRKAEFRPAIDYSWIYDVAYIGNGHFFTCGDEGTIYHRLKGNVWKRIQY
jgi:photosystem II stability/assembly factor-like uncharacterized protein